MTCQSDIHGPYPVMVLAHNEERHIAACLDSIFEADSELVFEVFVMANGCTDRTEEIVRDYSVRNPSVRLVSIDLGDKCNAWNVFVHETVPATCPGREVYFFVDGDARFVAGSFSAMATDLASEPAANAVSAPPASGRSAAVDRRELLSERGLVANLYGLRGVFIDRLIAEDIRIPLGLEGDDGLIGALIRWDLDPRKPWNYRLIVPCAKSGFIFESMSPVRPSDWVAYWKRMVRYGRRYYEFQLLGDHLRLHGIRSMPANIRELYRSAENLRLARNGIYTLTNWVALQEMRQIGRNMFSASSRSE